MAKKKIGRPSKYDGIDLDLVKRMAFAGCTDEQMAIALGVERQTLHNWRKSNPELFDTVKDGKAEADEKVQQSLFSRACGMTLEKEVVTKSGDVVTVKDALPPDPTSMIFWLKNRKPKEWRDKQEVEHSGSIDLAGALSAARKRVADGS